eukprot:12935899-Prorocentrum_lima.AAC.1
MEIIVRVLREVMSTTDLSRLSMASDVQTRPTKLRSTKTGLAQRLEAYYYKTEMAMKLGCAMEPRVILHK